MSTGTIALFVVGIAVLIVGAELLVRGASRLAARSGVSPVVIGLTVVAFGTSAPELAVGVGAALSGEADLALGNVVGSNVANVLLVLGLASAIGGSLLVAQRLVRFDVPLMIGASALVLVLALDGSLSRVEGAGLVALLIAYLGWTVHVARREGVEAVEEYDEAFAHDVLVRTPWWIDLALMVGGLALLVVGAQWLVSSATEVAEWLGLSSVVIGLTVVAIGTSMPEIATTVVAAVRGERDLAVGNAIGSNLFNLLGVLGVTALVSGGGLDVSDQILGFDLPVMLAVAVACLPIFFTGWALSRWEGFVFIAYYVGYVAYLVLDATEHSLTVLVGRALGWFVLPLTLVTIVVILWRELAARRSRTVLGKG